jgi:hypothetical protein
MRQLHHLLRDNRNCFRRIIHHIHPELKSEYVLEEESSTLWAALQNCYEQQNKWIHLRLQDYKSLGDYNHVIHQISAKL